MNHRKIYMCGTFVLILFMSATVILTSTVINLKKENGHNLASIENLKQSVTALKAKVGEYHREQAKMGFYHFKENVFNLKYPKFSQVARIAYRKSKEYGFSPYLVMALIQVESNFEQYAVSSAGAYGLMQINYSVWKDNLNIDFGRIFEREYNIDLGLKVLKHYYDEAAGNMFVALHRYNNGYKYNNHKYNARIVATKFYTHDNASGKTRKPKTSKEKNMSI